MFNFDSPFFQGLTKFADLVILNFLFIICCLPIVTIGPSLTALYTVTLRLSRNEEGYIIRDFFNSLHSNFKISFYSGILCLIVFFIFTIDFKILTHQTSLLSKILFICFTLLLIIYFFTIIYLFPYISFFENTLIVSIKNSFFIAIANLPYTILMITLLFIFLAFTYILSFKITGFFWLIIGFSGISYVKSHIFRKVFFKYIGEKNL